MPTRVSRGKTVGMAMDQEARDRADEALSKAISHELLCTERWRTQGEAMARVEHLMADMNVALNDRIGRLPAGIIAALTGLVGFLGARAFPS